MILHFAVIVIPDVESQFGKQKLRDDWIETYVENLDDINEHLREAFLDDVFNF